MLDSDSELLKGVGHDVGMIPGCLTSPDSCVFTVRAIDEMMQKDGICS